MKVITGNRIPIKLWTEDIEPSTMEQAIDLASLPFAYHHIALMPDAHTGLGMPIGGVLATKGVVVPNAVGMDIGCGMCAVKTHIAAEALNRKKLEKIVAGIKSCIPVGFNWHKEPQEESRMPQGFDMDSLKVARMQYHAARLQLGTLGGGNHFIEIQRDEEGCVWVMIHSGSRNLGKKVASVYGERAKWFNERWYSETVPGLEFMPIEEDSAKAYLTEMKYCIQFAFANRTLMMERILDILAQQTGHFEPDPIINIAHNYAVWEKHFGASVIVHRKGATRAMQGEIGIIPGSQGSHSYIVEGLGNPESFTSCSHGAGRKMGRKQAIRTLDLAEEINKLDAMGILHSVHEQRDLEEASSAYKDIDTVMENQKDLVRPLVKLSPMAVVKGV